MEPLCRGFGGEIDLYQMDIDVEENSQLTADWSVFNVPAFVIFRNGVYLKTFCQQQETASDLVERIRCWMHSTCDPKMPY